jgi:hypothetical protein
MKVFISFFAVLAFVVPGDNNFLGILGTLVATASQTLFSKLVIFLFLDSLQTYGVLSSLM